MKSSRPRLAPAAPIRHPSPAQPPSILEERRRSQRVMLRVPVLLHVPGRAQAVRGVTVAVSESGAMIVIPESLAAGTKFALENPSSAKKVSASVSRPARMTPEGALLPVEFGEAAPAFWDIFFPPHGN
jgi:hypothetical protein